MAAVFVVHKYVVENQFFDLSLNTDEPASWSPASVLEGRICA